MLILLFSFLLGRYLDIAKRRIFLSFVFLILVFIRPEFIVLFLFQLIKNYQRELRKHYTFILITIILGFAITYLILPNKGMLILLQGSSSVLPFVILKNILIYFALCVFAVINTLYTYKIMFFASLLYVAFAKRSLFRNLKLKEESREELMYLFVLLLPMLCVRNYFYYAVPFHLFLFIFLVFIFNAEINRLGVLCILCLSIISLVLTPANPNISLFSYYPLYIPKGQDHLRFYHYLKKLPIAKDDKHYAILSYQDFAPILARNDIKFYNPWFYAEDFCKKNDIIPDFVFLPNRVDTGIVFTNCMNFSNNKYKLVYQLARNSIWAKE